MDLMPFSSKFFPRWERSVDKNFSNLQREINGVLDSFFDRSSINKPRIYDINLYPVVDIQSQDDKYILEAELPGIKEKEVELDFHNNILTVRGEKKSETKSRDNTTTHTECYYGSFRRDIPFEEEIDPEEIKAELKKGVLHVELMKKEKGKRSHKKIEVKS